MANEIRVSIEKFIDSTQFRDRIVTVCVALSGGRDSVALLHCLKQLETNQCKLCGKESVRHSNCNAQNYDGNCDCERVQNNYDIMSSKRENGQALSSAISAEQYDIKLRVVAANVEHGIRGESSVRDSEFVKELCKRMGVELFSFSVDAPAFAKKYGYTLEQAARILRYRCFGGLLADGRCDYVALAHHLDDQIETVFMRILRGTGIRGLCGIKAVNGRYIRPLLDFNREDINEYVKRNGLLYVEDETNDDAGYTRNFLRKEINALKLRFPAMGAAIKRLCANAEEAESFIEEQIPQIKVENGVSYVKTADCENIVIAKRLILRAASALGVVQDIEDRHLSLALGLLDAQNGKSINLTHGLCVYRESDRLAFKLKRERDTVFECALEDGCFFGVEIKAVDVEYAKRMIGCCKRRTNENKYGEEVCENSDAGLTDESVILFADADKFPSGAVIRGRRDGDYIHKFGGGRKSLGDFLTDKKVPLHMRDSLRVIADGSRILAVFGVDISADVKIDENTRRAFRLV